MTNLLKNLNNELAPQKTLALYKRQEDKINEINEKFGLNIKIPQIVREGVDLVLTELEKQLEDKEASKEE
jgi:hypothetical protein